MLSIYTALWCCTISHMTCIVCMCVYLWFSLLSSLLIWVLQKNRTNNRHIFWYLYLYFYLHLSLCIYVSVFLSIHSSIHWRRERFTLRNCLTWWLWRPRSLKVCEQQAGRWRADGVVPVWAWVWREERTDVWAQTGRQKENLFLLSFILFRPSMGWMRPTYVGRAERAHLLYTSLSIQC